MEKITLPVVTYGEFSEKIRETLLKEIESNPCYWAKVMLFGCFQLSPETLPEWYARVMPELETSYSGSSFYIRSNEKLFLIHSYDRCTEVDLNDILEND